MIRCLFVIGLVVAAPSLSQPADLAARFAERVAAYEAADEAAQPPANAILLAGDSQFDRWKTVRRTWPVARRPR